MSLRLHRRLDPVGHRLVWACLALGYAVVPLRFLAPSVFETAGRVVPNQVLIPVVYLLTFAYPALYALLDLLAAAGVVAERSSGYNWNRRDHLRVYLTVVFVEWQLHLRLYLFFPITLAWGLLSLPMGFEYAIPVWALIGVVTIGVILGNRYRWYYDLDGLPPGATPDETGA